jgi:hypothetical protein
MKMQQLSSLFSLHLGLNEDMMLGAGDYLRPENKKSVVSGKESRCIR